MQHATLMGPQCRHRFPLFPSFTFGVSRGILIVGHETIKCGSFVVWFHKKQTFVRCNTICLKNATSALEY